MNRSYSKIRHIQQANALIENRITPKNILREYDIDDSNVGGVEQELSSVSADIKELNPNLDFSSV